MKNNSSNNYLYEITSTSQDGFGTIDEHWRDQMRAAGVICSHCGRIYSHRLGDIDRVVVTVDYVPKTHCGIVGDLIYNKVFSNELFSLIGRERIEKLGHIVPIENNLGYKYTDFQCVLIDERRTPGTARGHTPNEPSLCKVCGWLRYWPGWPPSKWYVLRREWPEGTDLAHLGFLLCSPELWEETIKPAKLKQLKAHKLAILDEPTDGWPADYQEMIAEIDRRGLRK